MREKRSEIFESYAKIAQEQGLIDTSKVSTAESMTQEEKYDSKEWKENIENLYGVKPNGKDDDTSIIEKAHPNLLIIAPSYDKVNGLFENEQQRQDIDVEIALRTPSGSYGGWKQAHNNLILNLVRIGNSMDNKELTSLANLADSCAGEVAQMEKVAFGWGSLLKVLKTVGPYLGKSLGWGTAIMSVKEHFVGVLNQGVINNCTGTIEALNDIKDDADSRSKAMVEAYIKAIEYVKTLATKAHQMKPPAVPAGTDPVSKLEALNKISQEDTPENKAFINSYLASLEKLSNALPTLKSVIENMDLNEERHSEYVELGRKALNLLFGDNIDEAVQNIETLKGSLDQAITKIKGDAVEAKQTGDEAGKSALDSISNFTATKSEAVPETSEEESASLSDSIRSRLQNIK